MTVSDSFTDEQIDAALRAAMGSRTGAARLIAKLTGRACEASFVRERTVLNESLRKTRLEATAQAIAIIERRILDRVVDGEPEAIAFYLKIKGLKH